MSGIINLVTQEQINHAKSVARTADTLRNSRLPKYGRALLGGLGETVARDIAATLLAVKKTTGVANVCYLVLSAMAMGCDPETLSASPIKLTVPSGEGVPAFRALSASNKVAEVQLVQGTVDLAGMTGTKTGYVAPTDGDAAAILAIAVYAAGKSPTDKNKDGFFGSPTGTKGRVGALKAAIGATDMYLTGERSLNLADLQKINQAFSSSPSACHALFNLVTMFIPRPLTIFERAVAGQARLLRSEGKGSFERALLAATTYGDALVGNPLFRNDLQGLLLALATLQVESVAMQSFGYILDGDAYETLRVSKFRNLAQLGLLHVREGGAPSTANIQDPVTDALVLARIKVVFDGLSKVE